MKRILILALLCSCKSYYQEPKPKSIKFLQPYFTPNGHSIVVYDQAVIIVSKSGNKLYHVYINSGEVVITDSTTFKDLENQQ